MNGDYLEFKPEMVSKDGIKETVEAALSVKRVEEEMHLLLANWWNEKSLPRLKRLPEKKDLYNVRREFITSIKETLLPAGLLDEFKVAGIFVNWWKDSQYTLKKIIADEKVDEETLNDLKTEIKKQLDQYLTESRQEVIAMYENWWNKYRVTAREIEDERDRAKAKLDGF